MEYLTRLEHEEFAKRMEEEHHRQNSRITDMEENFRQIHELTISIERMTLNVESVVKELKRQGDRLETLEGRDGDMWRNTIRYVTTACLGIVIGYIAKQIGF